MTQMSEQELLQQMAELIEENTKMVLDPETIKGLLLEVQREQLKGLVYRAFIAVSQKHEQAQAGVEGSPEDAQPVAEAPAQE
jgi:hypothetical protein